MFPRYPFLDFGFGLLFVFLEGVCANALPAALFESLLVRLSVRTFDALVAVFLLVTFLGALVCESALPAAVFDFVLVFLLLMVFDAEDAAFLLVTFFDGAFLGVMRPPLIILT